ncbi:hypothetical protein M1513_01235 [Patescibacteria group bacterium]|nr:hypothetical protein [Patescibacteria group bacterium]
MERTKIAAIVFVISAGIIASYMILKNSAPKYDSTKNGLTEENSTSSASQNPIKWLSKTIKDSGIGNLTGELKSLFASEEEKISLPENIDFENINLTEFVAKSSFTQMKNLDQSGQDPFSIDPNDPASKEFIEKAIAGIQNPAALFNPTVSDSELNISRDNSKEARKEYLAKAGQIILEKAKYDVANREKAIGDFSNNLNVSGINSIVNTYAKYIDNFINMKTPSVYLDLHKRYIVFLKKSKMIYQGMADYGKDPIKASLSIQLIPDLLNEELATQEAYFQETTLDVFNSK